MSEIFESCVRTAGDFAGIFEYEGETGYFYLYEVGRNAGQKVVDSIYILSGQPDFTEADVSVQWDSREQKVGLFIHSVLWAVFDIDRHQKYGGGYQIGANCLLPYQAIEGFGIEVDKSNNGGVAMNYDEPEIIHKLNQLDVVAKVAFAAACAERLFPGYVAFFNTTGRGDPDTLRTILDRVWQDTLGNKMSASEVIAKLDQCMTLIPNEDDGPWVLEQAAAENAAAAIAYALGCQETGDPQEAAWAARQSYEAADYYVANQLGVQDDKHVLIHPVVQAELARHHRDLDELLAGAADPTELVARLRDRARAEAAVFFGPAEA